MKKSFTLVAACQCGCNTGRVFHEKASSAQGAVRTFKAQIDPEWPMSLIAVFPGTHYSEFPKEKGCK